jgi:DNA-binding CsgD family transcriptional regulator
MKDDLVCELKLFNSIRSLNHLISTSAIASEKEQEDEWLTILITTLDPLGLFEVHNGDNLDVKLVYSKDVSFEVDSVLFNLRKWEESNILFTHLSGNILIHDSHSFGKENKEQIFSGCTSVLFSHKEHLTYGVVFQGNRSSYVLELIRELYYLRDLIQKCSFPSTAFASKKQNSYIGLEPRDGSHLTERQELILKYLREGLTNREIARKIGFSEALIKAENTIIFRKLDVGGREDAKLKSKN